MTPGEKLSRARRVGAALGTLFASTRVPVIVVERDGQFVAANEAALLQYGYDLESLLALRIHDLQASERALAGDLRRAIEGDAAPLERRPHRRKDGSVLWVVPNATPTDVDGERFVVSVLTDVTALVGAEQQALFLRERARRDEQAAELMWQVAVERLDDGFSLVDRDRRVVRVNRAMCGFLGADAKEIVGALCTEVFPSCQGSDPCPHSVAMAEGKRLVREVTAHASGKPLRAEVLPVAPNAANIGTIHVLHDLTEERALRSQLVSTDRLATIGRLSAGVAHEVNNPAGFVTLALQLVKDQLANRNASAAEVVPLVDEALTAMLQINQIMRDLVGFSRERSRAPVDLTTVTNSAIRIATHETRDRATVERAYGDAIFAEVRGARVAQVVLNLIVNAAQAIPAGSAGTNRIEVRVYRDGERACIDVSDTGSGVPAALGERIFEPFFTTREAAGGTGLGLWLSRSIVEDEGGTLTFRNLPAGGACFTVALAAYGGPLGDAAVLPPANGLSAGAARGS